jgi:ABC-2 type transport system permease protein
MRFANETFIVWRRQMRMNLRNPAWVIIGLAQPVLYLALFGPLLEPLAAQIGADNAYTFFVPGLLVQLGLFGALFGGMLFGLLLVVLLGAACSAGSNALALTVKSEDVMAPILNSISLPVLLLAGILLPISARSGAPDWLIVLSDFIPVKYVVNAVREVFTGAFAGSTVLWGTVWTLILFAAGLWVGTRTFRKENA